MLYDLVYKKYARFHKIKINEHVIYYRQLNRYTFIMSLITYNNYLFIKKIFFHIYSYLENHEF